MKCPFCGNKEDKVVDSRATAEESAVRRRRECAKCGKRFTTYEYVEEVSLMVIKKDGRREPFDRKKILAGIM
ncbi:MAG: transcriptional regulator NrdR, partial [Candidatus Omnitrophica bacterium]|nr:transcriptional regulator NrdR [Candidatus Omnitrophota bacterium]